MRQATADDVVDWIISEVKRTGYLDLHSAAQGVRQGFGEAFVYELASGQLAISMSVLRALRERRDAGLVWEGGGKAWRKAAGSGRCSAS